MRKALPLLLSATALIASTAVAQTAKFIPSPATRVAAATVNHESAGRAAGKSSSSILSHFSPLVSVSGADPILSGRLEFQTNGHGLHNIQVDPDHPERIHAVVMTTTDNSPADTIGSAFPSRRCVYSYSSDGGSTWSTPVPVADVRTGYPTMVLGKRDGVYFPIIAAHRADPNRSGEFISALFVEKGAPGTGDFEEIDAGNRASNGAPESLLWPAIAVDQSEATTSKVYIIGDYSDQSDSKHFERMEFGTFTLNAAEGTGKFDGWTSEPGLQETINSGGVSTVGKHVIRVAPDGRIGVAWINPNAGDLDHSMYFVESTDKGATWPPYAPLIPAANITQDQDGNDVYRGVAPNYGLDFFYDQTSTTHFVTQMDMQIVGEPDSNGYFFPYTGQIAYWSPNSPGLQVLNYVSKGIEIYRMQMNGNATADSVYYLYQSDYFDPAAIPAAGTVEFPSPSVLAYPTIARSSNPNVWSVFYQTVQTDLYADVSNENETKSEWYGAIYYQTTSDNGATWSAPKAFHANDITGSSTSWLDYRFPEASDYSVFANDHANYVTMFSADSLPGQWSGGGSAGWDDVTWFHQTLAVSRVGYGPVTSFTLQQNYPNPFNPSTTIGFTLKDASVVDLTIEDMMGRQIASVANGRYGSGPHSIAFDAKALTSGVYRYTLRANGEVVSKTMTLLK